MEKVTEFELMQALWDCSCYVRDLPTKAETRAIKDVVGELMSRWIAQQHASNAWSTFPYIAYLPRHRHYLSLSLFFHNSMS